MTKIPIIYTLGVHFLRQRWFPQFIADGYFWFKKKLKFIEKEPIKYLTNC